MSRTDLDPGTHRPETVNALAQDCSGLLSTILTNLTTVLPQLAVGDPHREPLRNAEQAALRAAELTKQLIGLAQPDAPPRGAPVVAPEAALVLLVDDEAMIRHLTRQILQRFGYRVLEAADGVEAVDLFRARGPEIALVILDLTMPRLSGPDTLRQLIGIDPAVRVVMSSGVPVEPGFHDEFPQVAGFLRKPYRADDLLAQLQTALVRG